MQKAKVIQLTVNNTQKLKIMTEEVNNAVNALVNCNKATSILFTLCLSYELEALFGLHKNGGGLNGTSP